LIVEGEPPTLDSHTPRGPAAKVRIFETNDRQFASSIQSTGPVNEFRVDFVCPRLPWAVSLRGAIRREPIWRRSAQ
jgi:hypothetical protein